MNNKIKKRYLNKLLLFFLAAVFIFTACRSKDQKIEKAHADQVVEENLIEKTERKKTQTDESSEENLVEEETLEDEKLILEDEEYYDLEDLVEYIHIYKTLPKNYIKKAEAKDLGWSVEDNGGFVIGGDIFYNREGLLPKKSSRTYYEADLISGYDKNRGPERIVFSDDGLIFYTKDHYKSFEQFY